MLNRNSEGKLFPSSPLEAHKNNTIVTDLIAVDQGYDNPLYAALEVDYKDSDEDPSGTAFENTQKVRGWDRRLRIGGWLLTLFRI